MKFDIIGDIHGCYDELLALIQKAWIFDGDGIPVHPNGQKACICRRCDG